MDETHSMGYFHLNASAGRDLIFRSGSKPRTHLDKQPTLRVGSHCRLIAKARPASIEWPSLKQKIQGGPWVKSAWNGTSDQDGFLLGSVWPTEEDKNDGLPQFLIWSRAVTSKGWQH